MIALAPNAAGKAAKLRRKRGRGLFQNEANAAASGNIAPMLAAAALGRRQIPEPNDLVRELIQRNGQFQPEAARPPSY